MSHEVRSETVNDDNHWGISKDHPQADFCLCDWSCDDMEWSVSTFLHDFRFCCFLPDFARDISALIPSTWLPFFQAPIIAFGLGYTNSLFAIGWFVHEADSINCSICSLNAILFEHPDRSSG
jgi:hypothetical protein